MNFFEKAVYGLLNRTFEGCKFSYQKQEDFKSGGIEGWWSRDGFNDDLILWSEKTSQMYRRQSGDSPWQPSPETKRECLKLGRVYAEQLGID